MAKKPKSDKEKLFDLIVNSDSILVVEKKEFKKLIRKMFTMYPKDEVEARLNLGAPARYNGMRILMAKDLCLKTQVVLEVE